MSDHREQFMRAAKTWQAKTGASVRLCDNGQTAYIQIDNPPAGFASAMTPEAFFAKIGGRFTEAPARQAIPVQRAPSRQKASLPPLQFDIHEYRAAHRSYGANCGYGAMAAILGITLGDVRRLAPEAEHVGGIHHHVMESAIRKAGRECRQVGANFPSHGVAVVKFGGAENPGHWVAVHGNKILDSYSMAERKGWFGRANWCDASKWGREIAPKVAKYFPGTDGTWWVDYGLEVETAGRRARK